MKVRLTVAALLLAASLRADEVKAPDDLALVPGSARVVGSWRPADIWAGDLGKAVRKVAGKDLKPALEAMEKRFGASPENVERATFFASNFGPREEVGVIIKSKKKIDAAVLGQVVPGGRREKVAGQEFHTNGREAAFIKGGTVLGMGTAPAVKAMLEGGGKPSAGLASALKLVAGGKHSVVAFYDGRILPAEAKRGVPPPLAMIKPLLEVKEGLAWADLGLTTKISAQITFANEDDAKKAEKTLKALKAVGVATLSGLADQWKKGPKDFAELADLPARAEKALDAATLKRANATIEAALSVSVPTEKALTLLAKAVEKARIAAARMQSANNLKQIALAMFNYEAAYGSFPARAIYSKAGKPLLSWRVAILPYIEQDALYKKFKLDEAWDSPHNKKLIPLMPKIYAPIRGKTTEKFGTFYQAFDGKGTTFEGKRGSKISEITDGTSNTLLVVEAGKDVVWTKPEDVPFDGGKQAPKLGGMFEEGFNAAFADGSVRFIMKSINGDTLKALITKAGGEVPGKF